MCPLAASQAILILYTVGRSCERVWPSCGLEEIILCSLKMLFIVCYIARVPVCVFCDGRTHGQTHNPILSGIRCFLRRRNDATQQRRELTNNSIDYYIERDLYKVYVRSLRSYVVEYVVSESIHHHHSSSSVATHTWLY